MLPSKYKTYFHLYNYSTTSTRNVQVHLFNCYGHEWDRALADYKLSTRTYSNAPYVTLKSVTQTKEDEQNDKIVAHQVPNYFSNAPIRTQKSFGDHRHGHLALHQAAFFRYHFSIILCKLTLWQAVEVFLKNVC